MTNYGIANDKNNIVKVLSELNETIDCVCPNRYFEMEYDDYVGRTTLWFSLERYREYLNDYHLEFPKYFDTYEYLKAKVKEFDETLDCFSGYEKTIDKIYVNDSFDTICIDYTNDAIDIISENEDLDYYFVCDDCGNIFLKSEMSRTEDGCILCEDCYQNSTYICERCGRVFLNGDNFYEVETSNGTEHWCESCTDDHSFYCNGYGTHYSDYYFNSVEGDDGYTYSEDYAEEHFHYCTNCDTWITDDDNWDDNYDMCCECAENEDDEDDEDDDNYYGRVNSYHTRPPMKLYGKLPKNVKADFYHCGLELEIDSDERKKEKDHNELCKALNELVDSEHYELYYNHDGSLTNGFEIIIQPHTYEALVKMPWKEILQTIIDHGYKSHDTTTCGLHMHLSRTFFGNKVEKQNRCIAKLINFFDANYDEILKVSRRDRSRALDWAGKYFDDTRTDTMTDKRKIEEYGKISKNKSGGRYKAVNNTNYNTVEFRIMRGTLKYDSFMACINFLYRVAMNSKKIKYSEIANNFEWLKGIDKNTKAYLRERNAFLDIVGE